mmetsp:Transcript_15854/g.26502  ORF Transcript_15854/g.26502 Transcript_15854/m.26502 type:complete len:272 (+) Transcript_15854:2-817(+)
MNALILKLWLIVGYLLWVSISVTRKKILPIRRYPHDEKCFTQGLVIVGDSLYESCGLYGKSSIRKVDLNTGKVIVQRKLERRFFAEGITAYEGQIYMLTWKNRAMLIFDAKTLEFVGLKNYKTFSGEGWGLTTDGKQLIASDGSDRITTFHLPDKESTTLEKIREIVVRDPVTNRPIKMINELQYANGYIYANVWYKDFILKIDPTNGVVVEILDLKNVYPRSQRKPTADCLNGIAYNETDESFLVTGKLWPHMYLVDMVAGSSNTRARDL